MTVVPPTPSAIGEVAVARSYVHARAVVQGSGSSFALGMRALPAARRRAMYAIYAFCREVDDIADGTAEPDAKLAALDDWREEIDRVFAGRPTGPLGPALADTVARFAPPRDAFAAMIDGMAMDAEADIVAPDWPVLELYCARVAGAVGRMSIPVFGAAGPRAEAFADTLGQALQLTNILRDLSEDAQRGRLYLPREDLEAAGVPTTSAVAALAHPALGTACRAVAARARAAFVWADGLLAGRDPISSLPHQPAPPAGRPIQDTAVGGRVGVPAGTGFAEGGKALDRKSLRPALLMMGIYDEMLARMVAADAWPRRPRLSKPAKLWAALRLGLWRPVLPPVA
ncbi:MAG: presqualene diphosphate synthase HpnD [Rhodospirillaceae bacterium]|nr:presqualene diphosphate synthase HpnD [Rhodospirillaceae bacterium]